MKIRYLFLSGLIFSASFLFGAGHGYHEWHDELNDYNFQEPQFQDAVPITPYENPNPIYYDYSPYLNPDSNSEFINPY